MKRLKFMLIVLAVFGTTASIMGLYLIKSDANIAQVQAQTLPSPSPSVSPSPSPSPSPTPTGQGCTPGFWKNNAVKNGGSAWPAPYSPGESLITAGFSTGAVGNMSLLAALSLQGG